MLTVNDKQRKRAIGVVWNCSVCGVGRTTRKELE